MNRIFDGHTGIPVPILRNLRLNGIQPVSLRSNLSTSHYLTYSQSRITYFKVLIKRCYALQSHSYLQDSTIPVKAMIWSMVFNHSLQGYRDIKLSRLTLDQGFAATNMCVFYQLSGIFKFGSGAAQNDDFYLL